MKTKKITFLFFFTLLFFKNITYSQQKEKNLDYYVGLIKKPKSVSDLTKAFTYLKKDKEISLMKNDVFRVIYELNYISRIQYKLGAYYDGESSAIEALNLLNDELDSDYVTKLRISLLNQLGKIKRIMKNYDSSLKYYYKVIDFSKTEKEKGIAYNNIGVTYEYIKEYDSALVMYKKAYELNLKANVIKETARSLDNLGFIQTLMNDNQGLKNMKIALNMREEIKDYDVNTSYIHLSKYYNSVKESKNALLYADKGYSSAIRFNNENYKLGALRNLINLKEYKYVDEYNKLRDSIESDILLKDKGYSEAKYNISEEQQKTKKEELEKEKEKSSRIIYQFLGGIVLLGSTFIFFVLKSRHKKGKLKERYDAERQISKKLHDVVANDLFHLMTKEQNNPNSSIELIDGLEDAYLKTRDFSKTSGALKISEHFNLDLKDLVMSYKTDVVNIFTIDISEMPWHTVSNLKKETVYRVLQELMTNMKKHSQATLVTLKFKKTARKIAIEYVDNGVGCNIKKSNGLQNVESRIEMVGGKITFESKANKGFEVKIIV